MKALAHEITSPAGTLPTCFSLLVFACQPVAGICEQSVFSFLTYSLGCGASSDSSDILA